MSEDDVNLEEKEENDSDVEIIGYYTRSKRRKLDGDQEECTSEAIDSTTRKRKHPIAYVPVEVLQAVFRYISNKELSQSVRLVNRRFKIIADDLLNLEFKQLESRMDNLIRTTEISLGYTTDNMEFRCLTKLLNLLDVMKYQYTAIVMTIWRYTFNKFYRVNLTCMYAGEITDVIGQIFYKFVMRPELLYGPAIADDWSLPHEIIRLCQLTKQFCVYFDKITETSQPQVIKNSGCKILDLLDAAQFAEKHIEYEELKDGMFGAKYTYFFRNSWLSAVAVPSGDPLTPAQKHRRMHMRLRRIMLAHNDMCLKDFQRAREMDLRPSADYVIKKPSKNVYTGYGEVEDTFFYYGVMNESAYISKFEQLEDNDDDDNDQELVDDGNDVLPERQNSEEDILYSIPHLGLSITVEVLCHLSYAPLHYLKRLDIKTKANFQKLVASEEAAHHIKVTFLCEGASYAHLPTRFEYILPNDV